MKPFPVLGNPHKTVASEGGLRVGGAQEPDCTRLHMKIPGSGGARPVERSRFRRGSLAIPLVAGLLGALLWAALAPVEFASREELFEIPKGTWARRMAGDKVEILPQQIRLTLGVHDVLLLRNLDDVPQVFGPTIMMPGQSFRLPFEVASSYSFACTAHLSGQMIIIVEPQPLSPWARLSWRAVALWDAAT